MSTINHHHSILRLTAIKINQVNNVKIMGCLRRTHGWRWSSDLPSVQCVQYYAVPDVVLRLGVFPGEVPGRALAGDLDHGQLLAVARQVAGRLARTGVPSALLEQCLETGTGLSQPG